MRLQSPLTRYGPPVATTGLISLLFFLVDSNDRNTDLRCFAFAVAILLSALLGGLGPGLLATGLSAFANAYFCSSLRSFPFTSPRKRKSLDSCYSPARASFWPSSAHCFATTKLFLSRHLGSDTCLPCCLFRRLQVSSFLLLAALDRRCPSVSFTSRSLRAHGLRRHYRRRVHHVRFHTGN